MANPPTASSGWTGKGLSFDGAADFVDAGNNSSINITTGELTVTAWFKTSTGIRAIVGKVSNSLLHQYDIFLYNNIRFLVGNGSSYKSAEVVGVNPTDNNWHHIVGTWKQSTGEMKVYFDGVSRTISYDGVFDPTTALGAGGNLYIGKRGDGYKFDGLIDDVRIYNRALTAGEVRELFVDPYGDFKPPTDYRYAGSAKSAKKTLLIRSNYGREKPPLGVLPDPQHPLQKGIVGQWLMNEGGGGTIYDLSGNKNHGTLTNMANPPTASSGWTGKGLSFDGAADYVDMGTSNLLTSTTTITFWVNPSGNQAGYNYHSNNIISKGHLGAAYGWGVGINWHSSSENYRRRVYFAYYDIGYNEYDLLRSNTQLNYRTWYHVAVIIDGTDKRLYINGVLDDTDNVALPQNWASNAYNLFIGRRERSYFLGKLDDIRIYNRALTAGEVRELYLQSYCMFPKTKISSQMFNTIPQIPRPLLDYGRQPIY
jgi:hypothetical protein